jgi:hypothetical protein
MSVQVIPASVVLWMLSPMAYPTDGLGNVTSSRLLVVPEFWLYQVCALIEGDSNIIIDNTAYVDKSKCVFMIYGFLNI